MVPALEHRFTEEPLPLAVVLDSDFVINVLHENEEFHAECFQFAGRLLDADTVIVYSNLLRIEFWNGWRSAVDHRGLPPEIAAEPPLLPDPVAERQRLYRVGDRYLRDFLRLFKRREVKVGARLLDTALALIGHYNLKSLDACVAACALHSGVPHIASLDQGFLKVDGIELWNNGVPGRRERRRRREEPHDGRGAEP